MIKPIETTYAGCRFRSRLEARWAVFFDALDIDWQYEPQGFELGWWETYEKDNEYSAPPLRYLPDFYLPKSNTWVEVKPSLRGVPFKLIDANDFHGGLPGMRDSLGTTRGLVILTDVPDPRLGVAVHPIVQHGEGMFVSPMIWRGDVPDVAAGDAISASLDDWVDYWDRAGFNEYRLSTRHPTAASTLSGYEAARSARFEHGESG